MVNRGGAGTVFAPMRAMIFGLALLLGGGFLLERDASTSTAAPKASSPASPAQVVSAFGQLPLIFEANKGRTDNQIRFLAHASGYGLYLGSAQAIVSFPKHPKDARPTAAVHMQLVGANKNSTIAGQEPLPGYSNYFIGNDSARWVTKVPQFARVKYEEIYPGVDLAFYGKQGQLEYDFDVKPGADPRQIELAFDDNEDLSLAPNGDLVLGLKSRELRFKSPRIYQNSSSGPQLVAGSFILRGNHHAGFEIGNYDRSRTLVIDPVLAFSSYLGGPGDESCSAITGLPFVPHCPAIAVDSASRIYVAGSTTSDVSFAGSTGPNLTGGADVFIARLDPSGSSYTLGYVTYIGGSGREYPAGVGVDSGFNAYVAGTTNSSDFPSTVGAFQSAPLSNADHAFVSKVDSSGSAVLYSTYLSGSGTDTTSGMALDSLGRVYLMGITNSADFPHTAGALQPAPAAANPATQFFFSKADPASTGTNSLAYSTYIGGSNPPNGVVLGGAIALDSSSNVYLAGGTNFVDMPLDNAYQSANQGGDDIWAARLNAPASNTQIYTPNFETYFGGSGDDIAYGVATDPASTVNMYITGSTTSPSLPLIPANTPSSTAPFPRPYGSGTDAFIAKFGALLTSGTNSGKVPLNYFTYLDGSGTDVGQSIVADSAQNARVAGFTNSGNFFINPSPSAVQTNNAGGNDAFYARILTTGVSTATSSTTTFLGGPGNDRGTSIALDSALRDYMAGETASAGSSFNTANPLQGSLLGPTDAFVSRLGPSVSLSMPALATSNPSPVGVGGQVKFVYSIFNNGDPVSGVIFTDSTGTSSTVTASSSVGTCGTTASSTLVCNIGTLPASTSSTTAAATVTVTANVPVPSPPLTSTSAINNTGVLTVTGSNLSLTATGVAFVNDFVVSAAPPVSLPITAGTAANYQVDVTPTGSGFPASVSLACGSNMPSGASCAFTNNPIPNMNGAGAHGRALQVNTTARVTTTTSIFHPNGALYAVWLSLFGVVGTVGLTGFGFSRKRKILLGLFLGAIAAATLGQAACGSGSGRTITTTGTPAGTYTVTINATSGSATRTTTVQLTVK